MIDTCEGKQSKLCCCCSASDFENSLIGLLQNIKNVIRSPVARLEYALLTEYHPYLRSCYRGRRNDQLIKVEDGVLDNAAAHVNSRDRARCGKLRAERRQPITFEALHARRDDFDGLGTAAFANVHVCFPATFEAES